MSAPITLRPAEPDDPDAVSIENPGPIAPRLESSASALAPAPPPGRLTTPIVLRLGLVALCLPILLFGLAVQLGVSRHDRAADILETSATEGGMVAQAIKLDLAELDAIVAEDLSAPLDLRSDGFPENYDAKHTELQLNMVAAASATPDGYRFQDPLVSMDNGLTQYNALVREMFATADRGDTARAARLYRQAHNLMDGQIQPAAAELDAETTELLGETGERRRSDATATHGLVRGLWIASLVVLVVAQILVTRKFRRLLNLGLLAATLLVAATGVVMTGRLDRADSTFTKARAHTAGPDEVLAEAQVSAAMARQLEAQLLIDPTGAIQNEADFMAASGQLLRLPDISHVAEAAQAVEGEELPEEARGYLVTLSAVDYDTAETLLEPFRNFLAVDASMRALVAAGDVVSARALYRSEEAFGQLAGAIEQARARHQQGFARDARIAADATDGLTLLNAVVLLALLLLVVSGLYPRIREYRG